ncbi:hypothetical protein [Sphingobium sp.]|uniref:hypothetical protein n=1 Tax=Sphingobium sp. TaxID=1912891 RepID=UPI0025EA5C95|nr:hypothetical protein [Sphingobium sp.]
MAFIAALAMDRCESEQRLPLAERTGSPSSFRYKEGEERLMVEAANAASNFVGYLRKSWPESLRATVSPLTYRVTVPRSNRCEPGLSSREHDRKRPERHMQVFATGRGCVIFTK